MLYDEKLALLQKPIRLEVIGKYLGQLLIILALLIILPLVVSLLYMEYDFTIRYVVVECILFALGLLLIRINTPAAIQTNEGLAITSLIFIISPLIMTIPLMGSGLDFIDALFEAASAFTTTGLSTATELQHQPRTFLFTRTYMQWIGGLGIVVLTVALLIRPGRYLKKLIDLDESKGMASSTRTYARRISVIYLALTVLCISIIWAANGDFFDAVTHAFAAVSTGGFSNYDNSLAGFNSSVTTLCVILGCVFGALPLLLYFRIRQYNLLQICQDVQVRALVFFILCISILLAFALADSTDMPLSEVLFHAPLMVISAQTTAGFSSIDTLQIGTHGMLILMIAMFVGGSLGSTAGGIKIYRILIFWSALQHMLQKSTATPHAVIEPHLAGGHLETEEINKAMLIILLFFFTIIFSWLAFLFSGYDPINSLFEVVSAVGTVGLSSGIISADLPTHLKLILCVDMLLGRLEFFALLVLVYPLTWFNKRSA